MLVERFGAVTGCLIVAGGLAAIGIIAAIVVSAREHKEEVADELKETPDTQVMISDATAPALPPGTPAMSSLVLQHTGAKRSTASPGGFVYLGDGDVGEFVVGGFFLIQDLR
jgi:hypothetical protein